MPLVTPKSDKELSTLLKKGIGKFEVVTAEDKISKKGDDMIKLLLKCWDSENNQQNVFDYLIFNDEIFNQAKIKHFCYATGLHKEYESGTFVLTPYQCENKEGTLKIGISIDKTGQYGDKNCVQDYIKPLEGSTLTSTPLKDLNDSLDDIAF